MCFWHTTYQKSIGYEKRKCSRVLTRYELPTLFKTVESVKTNGVFYSTYKQKIQRLSLSDWILSRSNEQNYSSVVACFSVCSVCSV